MFVSLPSSLELKELLAKNPPPFKYHPDEFKYIISLIIQLKSQHKDYLEADYVPINAQMLQRKIRGYNRCLEYLVENGIIETDNSYIPGTKSRGYRLVKEYAEQGYKMDDIAKLSLIRKSPEERQKAQVLKRNYGYLTKWFNSGLQLDYNGAVSSIKELLNKEQQAGEDNAVERYHLRLLSIEKLNKGLFHLSVDNTCNRFHSNLTNLKSSIRNFLRYEGRQLCSVDIKNSQPFFSTIFFNPDFYRKESQGTTLYSLSPAIYKKANISFSSILSILSSIISNSSFIMLVKSDVMQCSSGIERYCTLVDKGGLYGYINEQYSSKTGTEFDLSIPEQKKQLKNMIFTTLFSDNRFFHQQEAQEKRFFAELFPDVYQVFALIKRKGKEILPVILQLLESEIVVRRAARTISRKHPSLPIFTIHDSIVTLAEYKEIVRQELKSQCEAAIGLQPTLSFDMWS